MEQRTPEWHKARVGKITGSSAGAILGLDPYRDADDVLRAMVRAYHGAEPEFTGNVATEYGARNEENALWEYELDMEIRPASCCFILHENGWLGASPDGLIGHDGVLEIKCPYGIRDQEQPVFKTIEEQPHYHAQMQVEMFCTGRAWCHFYQWAPNGTTHDVVRRDNDWLDKNLPKLEAFYQRYLSEIENPDHLAPKRVEIESATMAKVLEEYDELQDAIDQATARRKEILQQIIEAAKEKDALVCGRKLTKVERKGAVDYGKIPELKAVDLEKYRKKSTTFWQIR